MRFPFGIFIKLLVLFTRIVTRHCLFVMNRVDWPMVKLCPSQTMTTLPVIHRIDGDHILMMRMNALELIRLVEEFSRTKRDVPMVRQMENGELVKLKMRLEEDIWILDISRYNPPPEPKINETESISFLFGKILDASIRILRKVIRR